VNETTAMTNRNGPTTRDIRGSIFKTVNWPEES